MPDQDKIRLMAQLAIIEKENGKELQKLQESFRSDYIGIPMLKNALRITAVFLTILCIWAVSQADFLLDMLTTGELHILAIGMLTAYLLLLAGTLIITYISAASRYRRNYLKYQEYQNKLEQLAQLDEEW